LALDSGDCTVWHSSADSELLNAVSKLWMSTPSARKPHRAMERWESFPFHMTKLAVNLDEVKSKLLRRKAKNTQMMGRLANTFSTFDSCCIGTVAKLGIDRRISKPVSLLSYTNLIVMRQQQQHTAVCGDSWEEKQPRAGKSIDVGHTPGGPATVTRSSQAHRTNVIGPGPEGRHGDR
jgi:hypothetical protein